MGSQLLKFLLGLRQLSLEGKLHIFEEILQVLFRQFVDFLLDCVDVDFQVW
jgi:hypothetical protein